MISSPVASITTTAGGSASGLVLEDGTEVITIIIIMITIIIVMIIIIILMMSWCLRMVLRSLNHHHSVSLMTNRTGLKLLQSSNKIGHSV